AGWAAACGEIAARLSLPVLLAAFAGTLATGAVQVGGLFSMEAVKPKLERIDPGRGARRILGSRGWIEAAKSLLKFAIVAGAAMLAAHSAFQDIVRSATLDASALAVAVGGLLLRTALIAGGALVVLGFADLAYQRWRHRRDLRMTREEVKREHKEEEGQPEIKAERMRLHREMLAHRMVMDVPRATCVIVNPTHVAVALRYDGDDEDAAPIVLAKGEGELARRIVEAARAAGVPVLRNAPVARSLLACELGEAIPERLFEAVAEVMRVILAEEE
ncbi:MAG: EscU/YscU/HrcU family type III secretion system export apparatus switch protein, partial [bacterium]|nr:EscU/YscU/HrcU family type III secretion system export apparatus switch protein [bacterium]